MTDSLVVCRVLDAVPARSSSRAGATEATDFHPPIMVDNLERAVFTAIAERRCCGPDALWEASRLGFPICHELVAVGAIDHHTDPTGVTAGFQLDRNNFT